MNYIISANKIETLLNACMLKNAKKKKIMENLKNNLINSSYKHEGSNGRF